MKILVAFLIVATALTGYVVLTVLLFSLHWSVGVITTLACVGLLTGVFRGPGRRGH
jgi:hypothetical protein